MNVISKMEGKNMNIQQANVKQNQQPNFGMQFVVRKGNCPNLATALKRAEALKADLPGAIEPHRAAVLTKLMQAVGDTLKIFITPQAEGIDVRILPKTSNIFVGWHRDGLQGAEKQSSLRGLAEDLIGILSVHLSNIKPPAQTAQELAGEIKFTTKA